MDFQHSPRSLALQVQVNEFMQRHVLPVEDEYHAQVRANPSRTPALMQALKARAKAQGLWNLFLTGEHGPGLTNLEYAPIKEIMGRVMWGPEVFNCSAPDVGNMELLAQYGDEAQKKAWLEPLLAGEIRSGFSMTEPEVAGSNPRGSSAAETITRE